MLEKNNAQLLLENKRFDSKLIIGVSGFARAGKNSLCDILKEQAELSSLKVKIFSFAFSLKSDLDSFCKQKFNVSSFCETDEKNIIRPILIAYGECQRNISLGSFWWKKIMQEINAFYENSGDVAIISDLRFKEYEFDELDYVRSYSNSLVFSVERFLENGRKIEAAHKTEGKNIPIIAKSSDFVLKWKTFDKTNRVMPPQVRDAIATCLPYFKKINLLKNNEI